MTSWVELAVAGGHHVFGGPKHRVEGEGERCPQYEGVAGRMVACGGHGGGELLEGDAVDLAVTVATLEACSDDREEARDRDVPAEAVAVVAGCCRVPVVDVGEVGFDT